MGKPIATSWRSKVFGSSVSISICKKQVCTYMGPAYTSTVIMTAAILCCAGLVAVDLSINSAALCGSWCNAHPEKCAGISYTVNSVGMTGACEYCPPQDARAAASCTGAATVTERSGTACVSNKCLACPGEVTTVTHNTSVFISQSCKRLIPYDNPGHDTAVEIKFLAGAQNVSINGPGYITSPLPIVAGRHFQAHNVTFVGCGDGSVARAAVFSGAGGLVRISGYVEPAHALSLFATTPYVGGGQVVFDAGSFIQLHSGDRRVNCAAAIAHAAGDLDISCDTPRGYIVLQDIEHARGPRIGDGAAACAVLNLTSLLATFGTEYEVQFYEGPAMISTAITPLYVMASITGAIGIFTLIVHHDYWNQYISLI